MALVRVSFVGGGAGVAQSLLDFVSRNQVPAQLIGDAMEVSVSSFEECRRLGSHIAQFISGSEEVLPLRVDGPGADSTLRRLGTPDDCEMISGLLASSARLQ